MVVATCAVPYILLSLRKIPTDKHYRNDSRNLVLEGGMIRYNLFSGELFIDPLPVVRWLWGDAGQDRSGDAGQDRSGENVKTCQFQFWPVNF